MDNRISDFDNDVDKFKISQNVKHKRIINKYDYFEIAWFDSTKLTSSMIVIKRLNLVVPIVNGVPWWYLLMYTNI